MTTISLKLTGLAKTDCHGREVGGVNEKKKNERKGRRTLVRIYVSTCHTKNVVGSSIVISCDTRTSLYEFDTNPKMSSPRKVKELRYVYPNSRYDTRYQVLVRFCLSVNRLLPPC